MSTILDERKLDFNHLRQEFEHLLCVLKKLHQEAKRLDEVERDVMAMLVKMGKAALEDFVEAAGNGDVGETLENDGNLLRRMEGIHSRTYRSIFGVVIIQRHVYAKRKRQKHEAVPLDQQLGLPADETSYLLEQWMGSLATYLPYDTAAKWLRDTFGIGAGSTTIENRVRQLAEHAESFSGGVIDELSEKEGEVIVALADAKGVPIRTPWEQIRTQALGRKPHLRHRKNNYERTQRRMLRGDQAKTQQATVGACYSIDRNVRTTEEVLNRHEQSDVPQPRNKRLWAEMSTIRDGQESRGAERIFQQLAANVALRDRSGCCEVICLMDGATSLWSLKRHYLPQATSIVDIFHVTEKLWGVAHCLELHGSKAAEDRVTHWLRMLLEGKVDCVRGVFQRMLNQQKWSTAKRTAIQHAIDYFRTNREAMQYHIYLSKGHPIGSGVIEGACKHVIGDRFCGSGMRWAIEGAQPLLHLRTIHLNGRWEPFINHRIIQEQQTLYGETATAA
jgi:hypothetical protein